MKKAMWWACAAGALLGGATAEEFEIDYSNLKSGTPPENKAEGPSKKDYEEALKKLDIEAVTKDMKVLLTDSKDFWPADFGNYGPFMVRLAWHCSGTYRASDGVGGCGGGRQRFDPEANWPDNTNLDKARALVAPLKKKYGDALSWGDLFILAGTTALRESGAPLKKMCFGRVDDNDGKKSEKLGPTALQVDQLPCKVNGDCKYPFGATTVGLVYVNPEGPMGKPDPKGSVNNVRQTFGIMGHSDRNTVALIGGGHAVGKGHGACTKSPGLLPKDAWKKGVCPWEGECGSGKEKGKGNNTVTAGFEGAWTTDPLKWDNEYFKDLLDKEWEKHKGPGGHWQWRIKDSDSKLMRLTSDISLLHDEEYKKYVELFADDMDAFNTAFDEAWFDLTTRYGSGTWADNAKCDDGEFPEELRHVKNPDVSKYVELYMRGDDLIPSKLTTSRSWLAATTACGVLVSVVIGFAIKRRRQQQTPVEEKDMERLIENGEE